MTWGGNWWPLMVQWKIWGPLPVILTRGGFSHWHGIRICACLLGHFFAKFGIAIGGFSSETKEPKLHKLGVFWANYCKKHPIWSKLGTFLSKMVYWWMGNLAKNWYRDSQIFEVRQAHPRTILVKEPPPREFWWRNGNCKPNLIKQWGKLWGVKWPDDENRKLGPDDAMEHWFEGPFDDAMGKLETLAMMNLGPLMTLWGNLGPRPLILFKRFYTAP